jgi:hypothetical protein
VSPGPLEELTSIARKENPEQEAMSERVTGWREWPDWIFWYNRGTPAEREV